MVVSEIYEYLFSVLFIVETGSNIGIAGAISNAIILMPIVIEECCTVGLVI